ncbi:S8 family serine peptidase [Micromonospora sp. CPCC 206061]|uniref:S8 family serine peptidase n=1 Tax=Micromonospora sp. CPCC 206061 TaxID=3122410 RepID=UPI002FEEF31A
MKRTAIAAVVLGIAAAGQTASSPHAAAAPQPGATVEQRSVTLLTGDKVILGPTPQAPVRIVRAKGRENIGFSVRKDRGGVYVVPADAAKLVAGGQLDARLFDVAGLVAQGYGDADGKTLSVIVQYQPGTSRTAAQPDGARVTRQLPAVGGAALRITKGDNAYWKSISGGGTAPKALGAGVAKVWLNGIRKPLLDRSTAQIGAPAAWRAGYTGKGVMVAVLDTGVDDSHPDLVGRIAEARNFTEDPDTVDRVGHGTHVAATIGSKDAEYRGVAPEATLVSGKVCVLEGCPDDAIIAGLQWAAAERRVKVVNLSLGGQDFPGVDPLEEAVNRLTAEHGTLFVVAAGNSGTEGDETVGSPASADAALAVGAVNRRDVLADFSSRGPRVGDGAVKPDITAPGVGIVAARGKDGIIGEPGQTRVALDGTSMATPHVAGAAALLLQQHPDWTPGQVKAALMASAKPTGDLGAYGQGAGRVDLARAIKQTVLVEQPSLSFGTQEWPHNDDKPVTRTLTYRNVGPDEVTLDLAVEAAAGPDGKPAPAGMFLLAEPKVTVPAGGTGTVEVTADTRVGSADGAFTARVVAKSGDLAVVTAMGVVREEESYNLTIPVIGRDGQPAPDYEISLYGYDRFLVKRLYDPSGTANIRLPRGRYLLSSSVFTGENEHDTVVRPFLDLTKDQSVTLDARKTTPVTATVRRPEVKRLHSLVGINLKAGDSGYTAVDWVAGDSVLRSAHVGPDAPPGRVAGVYHAVLAKPAPDGGFVDAPYVYNLGWFTPNRMYTGTRVVRDDDLAKVRVRTVPRGEDQMAMRVSIPTSTAFEGASAGLSIGLDVRLPSERTELFTTDGVAWQTTSSQDNALQVAPGRQYRPGEHREVWHGGGVFGPSLPGPRYAVSHALQLPDAFWFNVALFSPSSDTWGVTTVDSARTVVRQNGKVICESAGAGTCITDGRYAGQFRVEAEATQGMTDVSTRVSAVWTFAKEDDKPADLPIQVIRFGAKLNDDNSAPGGRIFPIPVQVQRNPGAPATSVKSLTVEASFDDGATWRKVPVVTFGDQRIALVSNPANGYVSLRAKAVDSAGGTVEQTIIHAYRIR